MTVITSESGGGAFGYDPPPLDVAVGTEDPSAWVIAVRGELDMFTGPILKQHLEAYKSPGGDGHPRRIVYVLPEVGFLDARGLHSLLTAVDGHGAETISIREPSPVVRRLLELVGMDSMIEPGVN